jgi:DNA replication protein DnaC
MTTISEGLSSCGPIFFKTFNQWLEVIGLQEATALLSRLQSHCQNSFIKRDYELDKTTLRCSFSYFGDWHAW